MVTFIKRLEVLERVFIRADEGGQKLCLAGCSGGGSERGGSAFGGRCAWGTRASATLIRPKSRGTPHQRGFPQSFNGNRVWASFSRFPFSMVSRAKGQKKNGSPQYKVRLSNNSLIRRAIHMPFPLDWRKRLLMRLPFNCSQFATLLLVWVNCQDEYHFELAWTMVATVR